MVWCSFVCDKPEIKSRITRPIDGFVSQGSQLVLSPVSAHPEGPHATQYNRYFLPERKFEHIVYRSIKKKSYILFPKMIKLHVMSGKRKEYLVFSSPFFTFNLPLFVKREGKPSHNRNYLFKKKIAFTSCCTLHQIGTVGSARSTETATAWCMHS